MPGWEAVSAFFAAALFLAIAPGPDNIFVLTQSALYGARAGIATTLGLATGLCFQTLAVTLGIAALVRASPLAFNLLKCAGAAYLCYLAWLAFKARADKAETSGVGNFPGYSALYKRGVIMNITNPKVCIFFLAFLPQFCDPAKGHMALQISFFGFLFIIAAIIVFFTVAFLGGSLAGWFNKSARTQIVINRIAGIIFLGLAGALVFAGI